MYVVFCMISTIEQRQEISPTGEEEGDPSLRRSPSLSDIPSLLLFESGLQRLSFAAHGRQELITWYQKKSEKYKRNRDFFGWETFVTFWEEIAKKQEPVLDFIETLPLSKQGKDALSGLIYEESDSITSPEQQAKQQFLTAITSIQRELESFRQALGVAEEDEEIQSTATELFSKTKRAQEAVSYLRFRRAEKAEEQSIRSLIGAEEKSSRKQQLTRELDKLLKRHEKGTGRALLADLRVFRVLQFEATHETRAEQQKEQLETLLSLAKEQDPIMAAHTRERAHFMASKLNDRKERKRWQDRINKRQKRQMTKTYTDIRIKKEEILTKSQGKATLDYHGWSEDLARLRGLRRRIKRSLPIRLRRLSQGQYEQELHELQKVIDRTRKRKKRYDLLRDQENREEEIIDAVGHSPGGAHIVSLGIGLGATDIRFQKPKYEETVTSVAQKKGVDIANAQHLNQGEASLQRNSTAEDSEIIAINQDNIRALHKQAGPKDMERAIRENGSIVMTRGEGDRIIGEQEATLTLVERAQRAIGNTIEGLRPQHVRETLHRMFDNACNDYQTHERLYQLAQVH